MKSCLVTGMSESVIIFVKPCRGLWSAGCLSCCLRRKFSASLLPHHHPHPTPESACGLITWWVREKSVCQQNTWYSGAASVCVKGWARGLRRCSCKSVYWSVLIGAVTSGPRRTGTGWEGWEWSRQSLPPPWKQRFSPRSPTGEDPLCALHLEMQTSSMLKMNLLFSEQKEKSHMILFYTFHRLSKHNFSR